MNTARLTRTAVSVALVTSAALSVLSVVLMPDFSGGPGDWLAAIAESPGASTVSALAFTTSQVFFAVGLGGVAHLVRSREPVLATLGGVMAVLGAFGHSVYGGISLLMVSMARDPAGRDTYADVLTRSQEGVALPFMATGLLGTVLGIVLLAVAVLRARLGARWLGPALILWVIVEFALSGMFSWGAYASGLLLATTFGALAAAVWRSSTGHWQTAVDAVAPTRVAGG